MCKLMLVLLTFFYFYLLFTKGFFISGLIVLPYIMFILGFIYFESLLK